MSNQIFTGHDDEMECERERNAAWNAKSRAERQIEVIKSRLQSALDNINHIGEGDIFGEVVTPESAVESALRNMREALHGADNQK